MPFTPTWERRGSSATSHGDSIEMERSLTFVSFLSGETFVAA